MPQSGHSPSAPAQLRIGAGLSPRIACDQFEAWTMHAVDEMNQQLDRLVDLIAVNAS